MTRRQRQHRHPSRHHPPRRRGRTQPSRAGPKHQNLGRDAEAEKAEKLLCISKPLRAQRVRLYGNVGTSLIPALGVAHSASSSRLPSDRPKPAPATKNTAGCLHLDPPTGPASVSPWGSRAPDGETTHSGGRRQTTHCSSAQEVSYSLASGLTCPPVPARPPSQDTPRGSGQTRALPCTSVSFLITGGQTKHLSVPPNSKLLGSYLASKNKTGR